MQLSPVCPAFIGNAAPELCLQIDAYCERTSFALDGEPLNTVTNIAMILVAIAAAILQMRRPNRDAGGLIWAAIIAVAIGGLGATLFHTTATIWTVWVDMLPFLVFMLIMLWLTLTRHFAWPGWQALLGVVAFLAVTLGARPILPPGFLPPAIAIYYVTPLLVLLAVAVLLLRRRARAATSYLVATGLFLAAYAARELDGPLCSAIPTGTHFLWHLLAAALAWVLIRSAILEAPPRAGRRMSNITATGDSAD